MLLLYAQKSEERANKVSPVSVKAVADNEQKARSYGAAFSDRTEQYHRLFEHWTKDGRKLAAYGAGHLTCAFLNFHDVSKYFAFVEKCKAAGINVPIIPGLKPMATKRQLTVLPSIFHIDLPNDLVKECKCEDKK